MIETGNGTSAVQTHRIDEFIGADPGLVKGTDHGERGGESGGRPPAGSRGKASLKLKSCQFSYKRGAKVKDLSEII